MFLKKVCIFLAASFLAVDIFLLFIYFHADKNLNTLSDKMLESAVEYYDAIGISVEKSVIAKRVPDNKIYTFVNDNSSVGLKAADNLAQSLFLSKANVNMVETPRGMTYTITDKNENAASLRIDTDSFSFEFAHSDFSSDISGIPVDPFSNALNDIDDDVRKTIDKFLSALYGQNSPHFDIKGSYSVGIRNTVCVELLIDDSCPVEGMYANMVVENGKLVYARGNIILAEISKSYSEELYDGVNALAKIDSELVSEFISEKIVYSQRYAGNGTYYLIPLWKIEYIDVNQKRQIQYVDAIKG